MPAERSPPILARLSEALGLPPASVEVGLAEAGVDVDYLQEALLDGDPQGALPATARRLGVPKRDLVVALAKIRGAELLAHESGNDAPETARRVARLLEAAVEQVAPPEGPPVRVQIASRENRERLAPSARTVLGPDFGRADETTARVVVKPPADPRRAREALTRALESEARARAGRVALPAAIVGAILLGVGFLAAFSMDLFRVAFWYLVAGVLVTAGATLVATAWRLHRVGAPRGNRGGRAGR